MYPTKPSYTPIFVVPTVNGVVLDGKKIPYLIS